MDPPVGRMRNVVGPSSWSTVNLLFPLRVGTGQGDGETGYFALAHWVLPRVPIAGEEVEAMGHRVKVDQVMWSRNGKVSVRLVEARVGVEELETLEREGWAVEPWQDEPPQEWLKPAS